MIEFKDDLADELDEDFDDEFEDDDEDFDDDDEDFDEDEHGYDYGPGKPWALCWQVSSRTRISGRFAFFASREEAEQAAAERFTNRRDYMIIDRTVPSKPFPGVTNALVGLPPRKRSEATSTSTTTEPPRGRSFVRGVAWSPVPAKWSATAHGVFLGMFTDHDDAAAAVTAYRATARLKDHATT